MVPRFYTAGQAAAEPATAPACPPYRPLAMGEPIPYCPPRQCRIRLACLAGCLIVSPVTTQSLLNRPLDGIRSRHRVTHRPVRAPSSAVTALSSSVVLWLLCVLGAVTPPVDAQTLPAVGDGHDLWILRSLPGHEPARGDQDGQDGQDTPSIQILHRNELDDANQLRPVFSMQGRVAAGGMACADGRLWLVYESVKPQNGLTVQSIRLNPSALPPQSRYHPPTFESALPDGVILRSFVANRDGPWALVRVEDLATLNLIDSNAELQAPRHEAPLLHTSSGSASRSVPSSQHAPGSIQPPLATNNPVREVRLLKLENNRWRKVPLPAAWPQDARGWMVVQRPDAPYPVLVTTTPGQGHLVVWTYRHNGQEWVQDRQEVATDWADTPGQAGSAEGEPGKIKTPVVLAADGQITIGLADVHPQGITLDLSILRHGVKAANPLGTLEVAATGVHEWAVVPHSVSTHGPTTTLLFRDEQGSLTWTHLDLQGRAGQPTTLLATLPRPLSDSAGYIVLVSVVVLAMLVMFIFWRREPAWNRLTLPQGISLADLGVRGAAGLMDLAPCVLTAMAVFKTSPAEMLHTWPGQGGGWQDMIPGAAAIAMFVLHTLVSELFTAQTLGKRIVGVRVVTLDGKPPNVWQVLARNLMKVFDLIAWPLLIMPLIGPYRQRLGDLAARTVVVTQRNGLETTKTKPNSGDDTPGHGYDTDK